MPPIEEVTSGLGSSEEEEGDKSEGGNLEGVRANSEEFGDETWELFSLSGVRCDSV
jgi:hypothetical protein